MVELIERQDRADTTMIFSNLSSPGPGSYSSILRKVNCLIIPARKPESTGLRSCGRNGPTGLCRDYLFKRRHPCSTSHRPVRVLVIQLSPALHSSHTIRSHDKYATSCIPVEKGESGRAFFMDNRVFINVYIPASKRQRAGFRVSTRGVSDILEIKWKKSLFSKERTVKSIPPCHVRMLMNQK